MQKALCFAIIGAVSVLIYSNSLGGGFVFDDHRAILTNDDLDTRKTSFLELFGHDFWGGTMSRRESHKSYRPLTVLTYRYLNYYFTKLNPYSYHLVNVIFHAIASMLFLPAAEIVLGSSREWSLLAALLFATHSIHTEAVTSVVGRAELVSCIFFLLSFLSFAHVVKMWPSTKQSLLLLLSICLAFLSMISKEQGITILGICIAYDVLLHWPWRKGIDNSGASKMNGHFKGETHKLINQGVSSNKELLAVGKRLGLLIVAGMGMMWFRIYMNYGTSPIFKPEEMRAAFHPNRTVRILSFSNIYAWNMWLLLTPSSLCCDWSLGSIPIIDSFSDVRNIWSLVLYAGIIALTIVTLKANRGYSEVGMGLAFMLIPFLPSTGIIFKVGFVIAERVLYLPSLGFCLLVVIGAKRITQHIGNKKIIQMIMIYILIIMSAKTVSRNWDWWSDLALFESGVKVNYNNVKMHNNYAMELKSAGRFEEAQKHYLIAIQVEPDYAEVYFNYGNLLSEIKNFNEAVKNFEKAMTYPSMYSKTLNNLATMYFRLGRYKEAEEKYKESLKLNEDQPMTYNNLVFPLNLASLYGEMKRFRESEMMFKKTIEMSPTYTEAYFNLGTLLYQMGRTQEAEEHLKYALKLNPSHHGALNNLKVIEYYRNKNA